MFNAPISDGVDLFVWIFCFLAAFGAGLTAIDLIRQFFNKKETTEHED